MNNKYSGKTYLAAICCALIYLFATTALSATQINPFLKSSIIPGWGQISIDKNYGYGMLTGEIILWSSYLYNVTEQQLKDRESYEFALKYAHINPGNYTAQYYRDLSRFDTSGFEAGGYNALVRQTAIDLYPYDPMAQQSYIDAHAIPEEMGWQWDSFQLRKQFSSMRKDILEYKDRAQLVTGIILANHLISAIDVLRLRRHWKNIHPSVKYYKNAPSLFLEVTF